jgi:hypothetical protein
VDRRATRTLIWIAAAPALLLDALYLGLIRSQGDQPADILVVPFVAAYLLVMVGLLVGSLLRRLKPLVRVAFRGAAAAGLIVLGVLAAFSIGIPILICGVLAAIAFGMSIDEASWPPSLLTGGLAAVVAIVVLLGGFDLAGRVIVCPASGESGGSTVGFFAGSSQWSCNNGRLSWKSG